MKITLIDLEQWRAFVDAPNALIEKIQAEVFVVRNFMSPDAVDDFKKFCLAFAYSCDPSWHPCIDGCPDYHRIHEQYPQAHVRSTQHGYYFHPWNEHFDTLTIDFPRLREIFELKVSAAGMSTPELLRNVPSSGPIARIVCHHYPKGGGGQEEHIDPVSPFAKVQTIIQASQRGIDYKRGGFYINHPKFGVLDVDALANKGDLILASPGVRHGVAPVDSEERLQWDNSSGRWIIMPIIIDSDHAVAAPRPTRIATV